MLRTSRNTLTKALTSGVLALTLALTGITATAAPAAANGHRDNRGAEAAAVFGGLLLLYGLSQAGRHNDRRNQPQTHQPAPQPQVQHRVAPQRCFIQGHDNRGQYRGYRQRCMQQHANNAHLLPASCLRHVWTDRGQRTIYGGSCLRNNGWTRG
jgi:hypothetical protein